MDKLKQFPWQKLVPARPILSGLTFGCWLGSRDHEFKELPMAVWLPAVYIGYNLVKTAEWESTNNSLTAHWRMTAKEVEKPKEKEDEPKPPSP